jgi:Arc/MetJ family transcription regulator
MTRTVLDVDRDLLTQAQRILGKPSLTATINESLRRVVADDARRRFIDRMAHLDDDQRAVLGTARGRW